MPRTKPTDIADTDEAIDLRSRGDGRRARTEVEDALARLARDLVDQDLRRLERLELDEDLLDAVRDAQLISSPIARNRQLRRVRVALRSVDWALVRVRLDTLLRHGTVGPASPSPGPPERGRGYDWVVRLLGEGQSAIEALVALCPSADRTHLRNLVRQAQKADAARRKKAEERLANTVESLLRNAR